MDLRASGRNELGLLGKESGAHVVGEGGQSGKHAVVSVAAPGLVHSNSHVERLEGFVRGNDRM